MMVVGYKYGAETDERSHRLTNYSIDCLVSVTESEPGLAWTGLAWKGGGTGLGNWTGSFDIRRLCSSPLLPSRNPRFPASPALLLLMLLLPALLGSPHSTRRLVVSSAAIQNHCASGPSGPSGRLAPHAPPRPCCPRGLALGLRLLAWPRNGRSSKSSSSSSRSSSLHSDTTFA